MTNSTIILNESIRLMEAGVLKGTGRMIEYQDEHGNDCTVEEPEPIHTFSAWKSLGYSVKKGEKSIARIDIWKYAAGKKDEDADANPDAAEEAPGRMFRKTAYFFRRDQVQPLEGVTV